MWTARVIGEHSVSFEFEGTFAATVQDRFPSADEQSGMSRENQKVMELVTYLAKQVYGNYQINLPLRNKDSNMPNNRLLSNVFHT